MIELIPNLPTNVIGFIASGQVTASDYETVIIPAIESALKSHENIRILYQLGPAFTGFSTGAMWDDMKLGITHLKAWEKIAIVTDFEWVTSTTHIFGFAIPCPVKTFSNSKFTEAADWIVAT